jgi:hypothetical protein
MDLEVRWMGELTISIPGKEEAFDSWLLGGLKAKDCRKESRQKEETSVTNRRQKRRTIRMKRERDASSVEI